MEGIVPGGTEFCIGKLTLRHRMPPGETAIVKLWDDGSQTAGGLNTMMFGAGTLYGVTDIVQIVSRIADTIQEAKAAPREDLVNIKNVAVTAAFSDSFYIETDDRAMGIKVMSSGHAVSPGNRVDVIGEVALEANGEKSIRGSATDSSGPCDIKPLAMINRNLGGGDWNYNQFNGAGQPGITGKSGANNIGLFIKVSGRVTHSEQEYFYIDDGSGLSDGSGNVGVKVLRNGIRNTDEGSLVTVKGISTCFMSAGAIHRLINATGIEVQ